MPFIEIISGTEGTLSVNQNPQGTQWSGVRAVLSLPARFRGVFGEQTFDVVVQPGTTNVAFSPPVDLVASVGLNGQPTVSPVINCAVAMGSP